MSRYSRARARLRDLLQEQLERGWAAKNAATPSLVQQTGGSSPAQQTQTIDPVLRQAFSSEAEDLLSQFEDLIIKRHERGIFRIFRSYMSGVTQSIVAAIALPFVAWFIIHALKANNVDVVGDVVTTIRKKVDAQDEARKKTMTPTTALAPSPTAQP